MSEKKRKAYLGTDGRPAKRQKNENAGSTIKVTHLPDAETARPIIASVPGVKLPGNLKFQLFAKRDGGSSQELLLHSSTHSAIDYTAMEGVETGDEYLKHYIAVYDPRSARLQLTEARKMTVRNCVRQLEPGSGESEDKDAKPTPKHSARAALTQEFGSKKSKKVVQAFAENYLHSQDSKGSGDPLSKALLSSIPERQSTDQLSQTNASIIQTNKPLPVPDLTTNDITKVYPLSALVFPEPYKKTLAQMPVSEWKTTIANGEDIQCTSRFVANRSKQITKRAIANPDSAPAQQTLQILRYVLTMLEMARYLKTTRSEGRLPPISKWGHKITGNIAPRTIEKICERFCSNKNGLSKAGRTLINTTILALALHIPPPSGDHGSGVLITEPSDLQQDLNLKPDEIRPLYRELGCRWVAATDAELELWGYAKKFAKPSVEVKPKFAKLKLPLEFPKTGRGAPSSGKKRR